MRSKKIVIQTLLFGSILFLFFNNCGGFRPFNGESNFSSSSDSKLRRLSNDEINKTIILILEDTSLNSASFLPKENKSPYDNELKAQNPSAPLVQGIDSLAGDVAQRLIADSARKQRVLGCVGTSASDQTCMTNLVKKLGRLFFRRTLTLEETNSLVGFGVAQATKLSSFDSGAEMVIRVLIQHPSFLYRIEKILS